MSVQTLRKNIDELKRIAFVHNTDLIESWKSDQSKIIGEFNAEKAQEIINCKSRKDVRKLLRTDLFLLLTAGCNRHDMLNSWCLERCQEVQDSPDGYLDLWAREHYKSTIITFGKSIQDIFITHGKDGIGNPCTIGILSYTRSLAQGFLDQIKREFETNAFLKSIFSDILYQNPAKESARWSSQLGLIVKRKTNPKEATVEAWGLVEGQPTSKHFSHLVYDDIITHDTVKTLYLTSVANKSWENSLSLGSEGGVIRYIGTRKNYTDTYSLIIERLSAVPRIYTAYQKNQHRGETVLLSEERLTHIRKSQGEITFACEYLQSPLKDSALGFNIENLMTHDVKNLSNLNLYMLCDPANSKKKGSDYTAMIVLGIDQEKNFLLIDGIRDRLNMSERWNALHDLYSFYPEIKKIFYEQVSMNNDLFYFTEKMNEIGRFFDNKFISLCPSNSKHDRICKIEPVINEKKLFLPKSLPKMAINGAHYDLVKTLVSEEIAKFPFPPHDDILDDIAHAIEQLEKGTITVPNRKDSLDNVLDVIKGSPNHGLQFKSQNSFSFQKR